MCYCQGANARVHTYVCAVGAHCKLPLAALTIGAWREHPGIMPFPTATGTMAAAAEEEAAAEAWA